MFKIALLLVVAPFWIQVTEPIDGYNPENRFEYNLKEFPNVRLEKPPFYDGMTVEAIDLVRNPDLYKTIMESMRENFEINPKSIIRTRYKLERLSYDRQFLDMAIQYKYFTVTVVTESNSESVCRMYFHNEEINDD